MEIILWWEGAGRLGCGLGHRVQCTYGICAVHFHVPSGTQRCVTSSTFPSHVRGWKSELLYVSVELENVCRLRRGP